MSKIGRKAKCVGFAGNYYQAHNCEIRPRYPSSQGLKLIIGCEGPRMLRLTAQYADCWNTAYLHKPESMNKPLEQMKAACAEVGRDIATLEITTSIDFGYLDLAELTHFVAHLSISTEEIAQALLEYDRRGVAELMFHIAPYRLETLDRLAEAMNLYRQMREA